MDRSTELRRYALGELPPSQAQAVEAALQADPALRAALEQLKAEDAAFFVRYPPRALVPKIAARASAERGLGRGPVRALGALAATGALAAALVVFVAPGGQGPDRVKAGEPSLHVFRQRGARAEELVSGAQVGGGDVLQLRYAPGDHAYAVVLSIDGAGEVTLHSPAGSRESTRTTPGGLVNLPYAYRLDAAPGFERFVLLTSDRPLSAEEALGAARRAVGDGRPEGPLPLPAAVDQRSILLRKATP